MTSHLFIFIPHSAFVHQSPMSEENDKRTFEAFNCLLDFAF